MIGGTEIGIHSSLGRKVHLKRCRFLRRHLQSAHNACGYSSRLVQKHKNKSVDTFSLRVFGEVTASFEVAFQSRSQHWQWFAACLGGFKLAGFNGCAESARIHRPQVIRDSTASILNHAASR